MYFKLEFGVKSDMLTWDSDFEGMFGPYDYFQESIHINKDAITDFCPLRKVLGQNMHIIENNNI